MLLLSPVQFFFWLFGVNFLEECWFESIDALLLLPLLPLKLLLSLLPLLLLSLEDIEVAEVGVRGRLQFLHHRLLLLLVSLYLLLSQLRPGYLHRLCSWLRTRCRSTCLTGLAALALSVLVERKRDILVLRGGTALGCSFRHN